MAAAREQGQPVRSPALLSSRDGYLLELTGWTKGSQASEAFGESSRGWPLGHAGDEGPHLRDDGGGSGWFSSGGPSNIIKLMF